MRLCRFSYRLEGEKPHKGYLVLSAYFGMPEAASEDVLL